jgi:hypothetical protein
LLLNPPEKKSKKFRGCSLGCATRLRAGFFGSTAGVFSVASAVASGVTAGASSGIAAGARAAVGTTAGVAAGTIAGIAVVATFAGALGAGAAMVVDGGRLGATGDGVTASARAANAAAEYCRTGAGGGWFLANEGSTKEWKAKAQTA